MSGTKPFSLLFGAQLDRRRVPAALRQALVETVRDWPTRKCVEVLETAEGERDFARTLTTREDALDHVQEIWIAFDAALRKVDGNPARQTPFPTTLSELPKFEEVADIILGSPVYFGVPLEALRALRPWRGKAKFCYCSDAPNAGLRLWHWVAHYFSGGAEHATQGLTELVAACPFPNRNRIYENQTSTSTTSRTRLDWRYEVNNTAVFVGECKGPGTKGDPEQEMQTKTSSKVKDSLPYLFGFAARAHALSLYVFRGGSRWKAECILIRQYDLREPTARIEFISAAWLILQLCENLGKLVPNGRLPDKNARRHIDYKDLVVTKSWPIGSHTAENVQKILLRLKGIAGIIPLEATANIGLRPALSFSLGIPAVEFDRLECLRALPTIISTVIEMHKANVIHRDLRWANIIKVDDTWCINDFDDAVVSDTPADLCVTDRLLELDPTTHAPELRDPTHPHTNAVDIWSLGYMADCVVPQFMRAHPGQQQIALAMHDDPAQRPTLAELQRALVSLLADMDALNKSGTSDSPSPAKRPRHEKE
eukprot:TRINITY_DN7041_c0_g1_i1.p1 TRINITY_DN7041_c0_g1~~TRINITY_DN7041_c0_g1_i1.p1  ORF type:complete len:539 (+),score=58.26 TRINITY_DN7041_c0_g1_i1:228-1844(+)